MYAKFFELRCSNQLKASVVPRNALVTGEVKKLALSGTTIYIDALHSCVVRGMLRKCLSGDRGFRHSVLEGEVVLLLLEQVDHAFDSFGQLLLCQTDLNAD